MQKHQRRNTREIKYLKKEEWEKLRDSIDSFRDIVLIELLYESGCRVAELTKINIQDIDFQEVLCVSRPKIARQRQPGLSTFPREF